MSSIFTKIINGEAPGRFVWKDSVCVGLLSIAPLRPGHTLVIPRKDVDHWLDLDDRTMAHLMQVAKTIGRAQMHAFRPVKVGLMIAGLEVRHVHLHVTPINEIVDMDFAHQDPNATTPDLDTAAEKIRQSLRAMGCSEVAG